MCHATNKFENEWLVYLRELKAIAVIGNECAGHDTLVAAEKEWAESRKRQFP